MKQRFLASVVVSVAVVGTLGAIPAQADEGSQLEKVLVNNTLSSGTTDTERDVLSDVVNKSLVSFGNDAVTLTDDFGQIVVPSTPDVPMKMTSDEGTVSIGVPFQDAASEPFEVQDGVIAYNNGNGTSTVRAIKEDGSAQTATIINSADAPENFEYPLTLPPGAVIERSGDVILIMSADGDFVGGFTAAWATDADGTDLPTHYEISEGAITQVVSHQDSNVVYPVVADPLYARGMIASVPREQFRNGGYEIDIKVTALAFGAWLNSPGLVATRGLQDLQEHHGRSMNTTNIQQWECHVAGLPATLPTINLEGWRRSNSTWRSNINAALLKGNPAAACNW